MQIWAESGKSALPICNYSQILYQFLTFTQNLKRSRFCLAVRPDAPYFCVRLRAGRNSGGPAWVGGAGHLFSEKWDHPSGDRLPGQPVRTSHAGGSGVVAVAGCKLCSAGFYKKLIKMAVNFPLEVGRASFFLEIAESLFNWPFSALKCVGYSRQDSLIFVVLSLKKKYNNLACHFILPQH